MTHPLFKEQRCQWEEIYAAGSCSIDDAPQPCCSGVSASPWIACTLPSSYIAPGQPRYIVSRNYLAGVADEVS
jgi:hypothetical protein